MTKLEDWSKMSARQKFGYWLVRLLGHVQQWVYLRVIRERVWRTAEGECIPVSQMTDKHLQNAIRMLYRRGNSRDLARPLAQALFKEQERRFHAGTLRWQ